MRHCLSSLRITATHRRIVAVQLTQTIALVMRAQGNCSVRSVNESPEMPVFSPEELRNLKVLVKKLILTSSSTVVPPEADTQIWSAETSKQS